MNSDTLYDIQQNDEKYFMDLHTAASIGCEEIVRDIIDNLEDKSAINTQNANLWTPLMYAACYADLKVVLILLEEGANPNLKNKEGSTSLIVAAKCGSTDVANLLIENRAVVNEKDSKGWSALFHSSSYGHRSLVQLLVEKGAQVNVVDDKCGLTPLMLASAAGHEMIVKDLLQYGANPTFTSKSGETARCIAIRKGHMKVKEAIDTQMFLRRNYIPKTSIGNDMQQHSCDVLGLLESLKLAKYYPIFKSHEIDIATFWLLHDEDLKEMGIELLGPRKKIVSTIARWHQNRSLSSNSEEQAFVNKLLLDNQKLQKHINELSTSFAHEKKQRAMAEINLTDSIQALKSFTEKVKRTIIHIRTVQEQLKETHRKLANNLCNKLRSPNQFDSWTSQTLDIQGTLYVMGELIRGISDETTTLLQQINFKNTLT